jgi:hypothetical protein
MKCKDGKVCHYAVKCTCKVPHEYVHATKSPDVAIVENLWAWMVTESKKHPVPQTEDELVALLRKIWKDIPRNYIRGLIDSIPDRLSSVIESEGALTKY